MYTTAGHIPRFVIALVILFVGTLYTSVLLFWQPLNHFCNYIKESHSRLSFLVKWVNHPKYATFIQEYHAPLVGKHRYWIGLLLLIRIIHHLVSAFAQDGVVIFTVGILIFAMLLVRFMIYCFAVCKHWSLDSAMIYRKWQSNVLENSLENSFLVNLIILALATFYICDSPGNQKLLAYISMAYSFIVFSGIIIYHLLAFCCIKNKYSKLSSYFQNVFSQKLNQNEYHHLPQELQEEDSEVGYHQELDTGTSQPYTGGNEGDSDVPAAMPQEPIIIRPALPPHLLREEWMDDLLGPPKPEDHISTKPRPCIPEQEMKTCTEIDIRQE